MDNPVSDVNNHEFILSAIDDRVAAAARADAENATVLALFNKPWVGKEPILWLIHVLVDNNEIKHAYLQHFEIPSHRMVSENHNTPESRDACCWTMMAKKLKDPLFLPTSILLGELHSDFCLPVVIDHNVVSDMAAATREKVKDKWSSLIHELKWKIENWEHSGQGDGGRDPFDNEVDLVDGNVDLWMSPGKNQNLDSS
jgi:hypothetical protein